MARTQLGLIQIPPFCVILHVNWNAFEQFENVFRLIIWFDSQFLIYVSGKWKVQQKCVSIPPDNWVWATLFAADWLSSVAEGLSESHTKHELINVPWASKRNWVQNQSESPKNGTGLAGISNSNQKLNKPKTVGCKLCSLSVYFIIDHYLILIKWQFSKYTQLIMYNK